MENELKNRLEPELEIKLERENDSYKESYKERGEKELEEELEKVGGKSIRMQSEKSRRGAAHRVEDRLGRTEPQRGGIR